MSLMKEAEKFCAREGHRLTDPRRHVLEIMGKAKKSMGAYDILAALAKKLDNPKPPTVYRAIDFWVEHGFMHRIESLNAYVVCRAGHQHSGSQYMICDSCGDVQEMHLCTVPSALKEKAEKNGFMLRYWNTELHGLCRKCG